MSKAKLIYICKNCDAQFPKWSGRCLECGAWGSLEKEVSDGSERSESVPQAAPAKSVDLARAEGTDFSRQPTGISEADRVLGGGLVAGSLLLLAGEPGIGKSTLLSQLANSVAVSTGRSVFYASGEESAGQIKNRLTRLKCDLGGIRFTSETNAERIAASIRELKPELAIVDSIQTMYSGGVSSEPGSVTQVRAATMSLLETAKQENVPVVLVGHITKEGQAAGPKTLEHIVDAVLYLEAEKSRDFRILRSPKNRFGSASEVGIFEMTGAGFQEVKNPTAVFLDEESPRAAGSVISCVMEGTRPFLVEVQALVSKTVFGYPQRRSSGFDLNRLQVLAAVLAKRAALSLLNQDIVLNVAGGLKVSEPSLDLAVCLAVASSLFDHELGRDTIVMGEVGLGGEVRNVGKLKERIREAKNLGFKRAVVPVSSLRESGMELVRVKHIHEAVAKSGLAGKAS